MPKQRQHFWVITFQRFRREHDGTLTPMTPADLLQFDDKLLDQKRRKGLELLPIRAGAEGIADALLERMREFRKSGTPYRKVEVKVGER